MLVICHANVCRSRYVEALLTTTFASAGVTVTSAGLSTSGGLPVCPDVRRRCAVAGRPLRPHGSRECTAEDLAAADLILVMTRDQERDVSRLLLEARRRTLTLVAAVALAESAAASQVRVTSFPEWVSALARVRGRVPIPVVPSRPAKSRLLGRFRKRRLTSDISDGHISGDDAKHQRTLDLIEGQAERLLEAWLTTYDPGSEVDPRLADGHFVP